MIVDHWIRNPYKRGTQKYALLERLKHGPLTNKEIILDYKIWNSTGRISDIRHEVVEPAGLFLQARRVEKSLFEYRIVGM